MESSLNRAFVFCRKKVGKQKAAYASVIYSQVSESSAVRNTSCSSCFEQEVPESREEPRRAGVVMGNAGL